MLSDLSSPVLSLAADVVKDLEGEVAVYGLWSGERVFPMPPVLPFCSPLSVAISVYQV